jgi:hypothetical protein
MRFIKMGLAFIALLCAGLTLGLSGCASTSTADYATLVQNTCNLATAEVSFLQSSTLLSASDQANLAKVAPVITNACTVVSANPQDTYAMLAVAMTSLTTLYLTYHPATTPTAVTPAAVPVPASGAMQ